MSWPEILGAALAGWLAVAVAGALLVGRGLNMLARGEDRPHSPRSAG
jgi:hypothetical protein